MKQRSTEIEILSHIFENHCNYGELLSSEKRQELLDKLQVEGYSRDKVAKAFTWLTTLATQQKAKKNRPRKNSIRIFSPDEVNKLGDEALTFIKTLEFVGVLNTRTKEILINQLMQLEQNYIGILDVKWVTFIILVSELEKKQNVGKKVELFSLILNDEHIC